jgi:hypothetical protein
MKKYLIILIAAVSLALYSCTEKVDIAKEKDAIIAVIEKETEAYINKNFAAFASSHVQNESNMRLTAEKHGFNMKTGWKETAEVMQKMFEDSPEPWTSKSIKTNHRIKVYDNCAWAVHDESWIDEKGHVFMKNIGVRFLEKARGEWKIVYVSYVNTSSYEEITAETIEIVEAE